jgi:hypothetical protein
MTGSPGTKASAPPPTNSATAGGNFRRSETVQHQDCEEHDEDEFEELDGMHAVQALQSR